MIGKNKKSKGSKSIFVKNLPYSVKDQDLQNYFKGCGEISQVRLVYDSKTGKMKG